MLSCCFAYVFVYWAFPNPAHFSWNWPQVDQRTALFLRPPSRHLIRLDRLDNVKVYCSSTDSGRASVNVGWRGLPGHTGFAVVKPHFNSSADSLLFYQRHSYWLDSGLASLGPSKKHGHPGKRKSENLSTSSGRLRWGRRTRLLLPAEAARGVGAPTKWWPPK